MSKLLSANLFRLRKSSLFWLALGLSAAFGAWMPLSTWLEFERYFPLDTVCFTYAMAIGMLLAVFLPLFLGTEHSEGAIRNKLAAGHTRPTVYLSSLATAVLVASILCVTYILLMLAVGIPLLGTPKAPTGVLLTTLALTLLMAAAYCSIYTLITMNLSRKAGAAVSCILLFLLLFVWAMKVYGVLDAPEFYPSFQLVDGEMVSEMVENPAYLQPDERKPYEFMLDLNPVGQAVQYIDLAPTRPVQLALCSLGTIAATTAVGTALFQRKDLK